jgi:hypothetical protein
MMRKVDAWREDDAPAAGEHDHADIVEPADVVDRCRADGAIESVADPLDVGERGLDDRAVREQRAFRLAGGAGGVDDDRGVLRVELGETRVERGVRQGPAGGDEGVRGVERRIGQPHEAGVGRGQGLELLEVVAAVEGRAHEHDLGCGVAQQVGVLVALVLGVQALPDGADRGRCEVEQPEVRARGREGRHAISTPDAREQQRLRGVAHPAQQLRVGPARGAVDDRKRVRRAVRAVGEQVDDQPRHQPPAFVRSSPAAAAALPTNFSTGWPPLL